MSLDSGQSWECGVSAGQFLFMKNKIPVASVDRDFIS